MKKGTVVALIVVVVVLVGAGAYAINQSQKNKTNSTMPNMNMTNSATSSSDSAQATNAVSIANFAFSPATIMVKKGTTVTWANNDAAAHTVTMDSGSPAGAPDSGNLAKGQTYSHTFDAVGTFPYHCVIHPNMKATVEVTD